MDVSQKLKALRVEAGLSVRTMASALEMSSSSYSHYEERYKKSFLPLEFTQQVANVLAAHGVAEDKVMELAGAAELRGNGFSESGRALGERLSSELYGKPSQETTQPDTNAKKSMVITTDGRAISVSAAIEVSDIDELIRRLELAKRMADGDP